MPHTRDRLLEEAFDRHGFIRRADALREGHSPHALKQLVARGYLEKVAHGVYRVNVVPVSEYDDLHLAVLWTGVDKAALSHETALALYGLGDVNPDRIHVTVPRRHRIRRAGADGIEVHHQDLDPRHIGWFEQIPTVRPATGIAQCIETGTPTYLLRQALTTARKTGRITASESADLQRKLTNRDTPEC
ncbi:type IV toxin-antitoxin system AbiEi family antitoxin domain-containing protein [Oerskovia sp. NPDC057915]|uniref:type IV toxin-antitoxin system AbiEi family antitoxin domain-containing protein n=1 Tax=Oerskovia sp. NPDC057915 TaxID=3346280 RepID=UPI0036DB4148